jgi:hypothetical protein
MPRRAPSTVARERFVRAANTRVNNTLDEIRKVAKLSSDRYEYTDRDIAKIVGALREAVDHAEHQLRTRGAEEPSRLTIIES